MKNHLKILGVAFATSSLSASATLTLVAGWDTFTAASKRNSPPTVTAAGTIATMSGTGNWKDWNNNVLGASGDGTFGNLSTSIASASTAVGTGSGQNTNLSLNRSDKPGSLTFSLVNNSGFDQPMEGFYFDGAHFRTLSAPNWELTFGGSISGSSASGTLVNTSMDAAGSRLGNRSHHLDGQCLGGRQHRHLHPHF